MKMILWMCLSIIFIGCETKPKQTQTTSSKNAESKSMNLVWNHIWQNCDPDHAVLLNDFNQYLARGFVAKTSVPAWRVACAEEGTGAQACLDDVAEAKLQLDAALLAGTAARSLSNIMRSTVADVVSLARQKKIGEIVIAPQDAIHFAEQALRMVELAAEMIAEVTLSKASMIKALAAVVPHPSQELLSVPVLADLKNRITDIAAGSAPTFEYCAVKTTGMIATVALAGLIFGPGDAPPGLGLTSTNHWMWTSGFFDSPVHSFDLSTQTTMENEGSVYKPFYMGFEIQEDAYTQSDINMLISHGTTVPAGTPIVAVYNPTDEPSSISYNSAEDRVEVSGIGSSLHFFIDEMLPPEYPLQLCQYIGDDGVLYPGETTYCGLTLDVTGSPTEIQNGDIAKMKVTALSSGRSILTKNLPKMWVTVTTIRRLYSLASPWPIMSEKKLR